MDGAVLSCFYCKVFETHVHVRFPEYAIQRNHQDKVSFGFGLINPSKTRIYLRKPIYTTRPIDDPENSIEIETDNNEVEEEEEEEEEIEDKDNAEWDSDEIETISSLFRGRIPQKPGKKLRERPLPLPIPYKQRPLGLPSSKKHASKTVNSSRKSLSSRLHKDPTFLVSLAKEIKNLPPEKDVSLVLDNYTRFLRKSSLSLTIRELGHMGLPERALQIFCWVQKQPHLSPDDTLLASTVEVLARNHELRLSFKLEKFLTLSSQNVYEAVVKGFIRSGNLKLAYKLVSTAKNRKIMLQTGVYAKLILELGKNPDNYTHVVALLEELGEREDLNLTQQDSTAIMKVCIKLGKFELVEGLYNWFKDSGREPSVVMYTTVVHSRYCNRCYREALGLVWEMEGLNCLFDLPAYRVVIKLFVALNDLSRGVRYFSKLKEAGFSPGYDIYMDVIKIYAIHGMIANCKEVCKEAEVAGFKVEEQMLMQLDECTNFVDRR